MKSKVFFDEWEGNKDKGGEIIVEESEQAIGLLRNLNGKNKTQLLLQSDQDTQLMIGGGPQWFIATFSVNVDEELYNLVRSNAEDGTEVSLVTGGQSCSFPSRMCNPREVVEKALNHFVKKGQMAPDLDWEKDF